MRNSDIGPRPRSTNGAAGSSYSAPIPQLGAFFSPCVTSSGLLRAGNGLKAIDRAFARRFPVIGEGPPPVPLPDTLKAIHFTADSWLTALIY